MEELRGAYEQVEGCFRGVVRSLYDNKFRGRGQEEACALSDVLLPGGDEEHDGRILEMVGREDEPSVAEIAVVADSRAGKPALHHLALQVLRHGAAPAPVKDNVVLDGSQLFGGNWRAVVAAEAEVALGCDGVFRQVHIRLEHASQEREVGEGRSRRHEAVARAVDGDDEGQGGAAALEELVRLVAVAAAKGQQGCFPGVHGKASPGRKDHVVVVAAEAYQEHLGRSERLVAQ